MDTDSYNIASLLGLLPSCLEKQAFQIMSAIPYEVIFETVNCLEIQLKGCTLGCELEDGVCITAYLFFPFSADLSQFILFCDANFTKHDDDCWLDASRSSDAVYAISYNTAEKESDDEVSIKAFQCIVNATSI